MVRKSLKFVLSIEKKELKNEKEEEEKTKSRRNILGKGECKFTFPLN